MKQEFYEVFLFTLILDKEPSIRIRIPSSTKIIEIRFHSVTEVRSRSTRIHQIDVIYHPPISRFCALSFDQGFKLIRSRLLGIYIYTIFFFAQHKLYTSQ